SAIGISCRLSVSGLHAACREARLSGRRSDQGSARGGLRRISRQSGHAWRGHRLAESVLGVDRCHGDESDALGESRRPAQSAIGLELSRLRRRCLWAGQEIVDKIVASSLIYLPSSAKDFKNPAIDRYLARYVRGSYGIEYKERIKVMKLLWDAIGTEF